MANHHGPEVLSFWLSRTLGHWRLRLRERRASTLNSVRNELSAEIPLGEQPIVSSAQDSEIVDRLPAAARPRFFVVDLHEFTRRAALPVAPDERASQAVPRDDLPHRVVSGVPATNSVNPPRFSRLALSSSSLRSPC
jgi:hypothetical protein